MAAIPLSILLVNFDKGRIIEMKSYISLKRLLSMLLALVICFSCCFALLYDVAQADDVSAPTLVKAEIYAMEGQLTQEYENIYTQGDKLDDNFNRPSISVECVYLRLSDDSLKRNYNPSYQWYVNDKNSYEGATPIEGATTNKFKLSTDEVCDVYYFVEATGSYAGQPYTAKSKIIPFTVLPKYDPQDASNENGFVKNINLKRTVDNHTRTVNYDDFEYNPTLAQYELTVPDYRFFPVFAVDLNEGKKPDDSLYYELRIDGQPVIYKTKIEGNSFESATVILQSYFTKEHYTKPANVALTVGTISERDEEGFNPKKEEFISKDVYLFKIKTTPALSNLQINNKTNDIFPALDAFKREYAIVLGSEINEDTKIKVKLGYRVGAVFKGKTKDITGKRSNVTLSLSDFDKDENGIYTIPIEVSGGGDNPIVTKYNLYVAPPAAGPQIIEQPQAISIDKGSTGEISVKVDEPENGKLSYQWYIDMAEDRIIEGANEATYTVPAESIATGKRYVCVVTREENGKAISVRSKSVLVNTNLNYVSDIVIHREPGTFTYDQKLGVSEGAYKTKYHAGETFNDMWIQFEGKVYNNEAAGFYGYASEDGAPLSFDFYYNDTPSTEGGTPISTYDTVGGKNSGRNIIAAFRASEGLPAGTHYVYCVITATSETNPNVYKTVVTNPVKLEYSEPELEGLEGAGTEDNPYLLTKGEDFQQIQKLVDEQGYTMNDTYFKMANDITLPAGWTSIGKRVPANTDGNKSEYYVPFCGHLDGGGHTLFYPNGAKALFRYANGATVKNLMLDCVDGGTIDGSALLRESYKIYRTTAITVQDVTMLDNFKSTRSGLVEGTKTMSNYVFIYGCKAKAGAQIGVAGESNVGTFIGYLNGKVIGCESWATVQGKNGIGGIVGCFSNSVGKAYVYNNSFHGTVNASGKYAGGILGLGFDDYTAPNAMQPRIVNCYVDGTVIGERRVGGIYGGTGVEQAWSNGPLYLQNNLFVGTVKATATDYEEGVAYGQETKDWIPGAIVGYMNGLNKNDIIENNHFKAQTLEDGSDLRGIGGVGTVDTSAVDSNVDVPTKEFTGEGEGDEADTPQNYYKDWKDKTFYFNTSVDDVYSIKNFVDREDFGTPDWSNVLYVSVTARNLNRDDDPLGKDKEKLARPATVEELANGTVKTMLNSSDTSYKNWVAGANGYPVHNEDAIAIELEVSGNYKTDYIIGEQLNTNGMVFTATMSDGTTRNIPVSDINITGFNSNSRAELTLTAAYGAVTCDIKVSILYPSNTGGGGSDDITVYFTLLGDTVHGDPTEKNTHTLKDNNLITWIAKTPITIDHNATVWDLLQEVTKQYPNAIFNKEKDNYVATVTWKGKTIGELDNGELSGWMYTLNGHHPLLGVEEQTLKNKDVIVWHYTDDYTVEEGSEEFNNGGGGEVVESKYTAADVKDLINKIGKVTKDSKKAIEEARKAYDSLTAAQQKNVTNYDKLVAAEKAYTELTGEKIESGSLPFADVAKDSWYYDAIKAMYDKGLMNGEDNNKFNPSNKLSRAMLVTILYRMQNEPSVVVGSDFNDIKDGLWYTKAVAWASVNNVVNGVGEGKFAPNDSITRQELAVMLYRYAKAVGMDTASMAKLDSFKDNAQVADWASEAMQWAVGSGLMKGNDDGTINPNGTATRAEVATVVVRLIEKTVK